MKKTTRILILLIFGATLHSCYGGTIGGLLPAPKFTKGKLKDNIYTSKDAYFSIRVPFEKGGSAYRYMQIKEQYHDYGAYVSFTAYGHLVYRLEVVKKSSLESQAIALEKVLDKTLAGYSQQLEQGYKTKPEVLQIDKIEINGNPSYLLQLKQNIENADSYHYVIVSDYENMLVVFMIQVTNDNFLEQSLNFSKSFKALD
ncbi:hypothetical protein MNBD_GAMMA01-699 [hydrothermal vent metagenome]|uniref:Uncharacterized protein n=1 Tax=hydrothermal vent metagenome TaxID=652676 RepID=A0A3B0WD29_9ZZZZ